MADFKLRIEKVVGAPSGERACGVFSRKLEVTGKSATLVACFNLEMEEGLDTQLMLGDLFEIVGSKFEESQGNEGPLDLLRAGSLGVGNYVEGKQIKASFAGILFREDAVYFAKSGDEIKFFVFDPGLVKKVEIEFRDGSGPVVDGQIFLLATKKFLDTYDVEELAGGAEVNLEGIADGLATEISTEDKQAEIAVAFVEALAEEGGKSSEGGDGQEGREDREGQEDGEGEFAIADSQLQTEPAELKREESAIGKKISTVFGQAGSIAAKVLKRTGNELTSLRRGDLRAILKLRRNIVVIAVVFVAILLLSGFYAYQNRLDGEKVIAVSTLVSDANGKYQEAIAIMDLNRESARVNLTEAQKLIEEALEIDSNNQKALDISDLIISKLKETEVLANITFSTSIEGKSEATGVSISNNRLYGIFENETLWVPIAGGDKIEATKVKAKDGLVAGNDLVVYDGEKIVRVNLLSRDIDDIFELNDVRDISYFIGNIYAVVGDEILKLVPTESDYSNSGNYLEDKFDLDLNSRIAIDGNVWLTAGENVYKFLRGEREDFEIAGLTGASSFSEIYTSAEIDNLYVVDVENSALLVISKEGVYKSAYQAPEFKKLNGIYVNSSEDKLYIASEDKIIEADINN